MNLPKPALGLLFLLLVVFSSGCMASKSDSDIEEVLQLNNDILEDPLLKELDELERSLLEPLESSGTTVEKSLTQPDVPAPAVTESAESSIPSQVPDTSISKKVLFGIVRKTSESGITLQVIQAISLTADELKKVRSGEKIPRTLLTEETLYLNYGSSPEFERLENGTPVPAQLADVIKGQRIRLALNPSGEIKLLRIIRD